MAISEDWLATTPEGVARPARGGELRLGIARSQERRKNARRDSGRQLPMEAVLSPRAIARASSLQPMAANVSGRAVRGQRGLTLNLFARGFARAVRRVCCRPGGGQKGPLGRNDPATWKVLRSEVRVVDRSSLPGGWRNTGKYRNRGKTRVEFGPCSPRLVCWAMRNPCQLENAAFLV